MGSQKKIKVIYDHYNDEDITNEQKVIFNKLKDYCLKIDKDKIIEENIENIYKYVNPKSLYIPRINNSNRRKIALLCDYKFNPDDGIAIVFKNEKFYDIGTGNII